MTGCPEVDELVREEVPMQTAIDYWLTNLDWIEDAIAGGSKYLNLATVGTYALAESISFTLFDKSARYYFGQALKIPHSDLLYEAFRNGFTHAYRPNGLYFKDDVYVSWAWSSDTSPSGFRSYYPGEIDPTTGETIFEADEIVDYVKFNDKLYQFSFTLDRLIARIGADLQERKSNSHDSHIKRVVGKRFNKAVPPGAKDAKVFIAEVKVK